MIPELKGLLREHDAASLRDLSKKLNISLNKIKNISCGRTSFASLEKSKKQYRIFPNHSKRLAEIIGIVLGDGNIYQFDRCQRLTISCNSSYGLYIKHIANLIKLVFKKAPEIKKRPKVNCSDIRLYMQDIDIALGLPAGNKIKNSVVIPEWIIAKKQYLIRCLKGLFETDGHYGASKKFYVEYIQFCNASQSLRNSVFVALKSLGYSPQMGMSYVRLARKKQVLHFIKEARLERPFPSLIMN